MSVLTKGVEASRDIPRQFGRLVNFYRVLGLRPGADNDKIKATYRRLIKQFHPDFNAGDPRAEQRTKDLNRAFETLGEPEARSAYDIELVRERAEARKRLRRRMATGVATFSLTIGLLTPLSFYLLQLSPPPPQSQIAEMSSAAERRENNASKERPGRPLPEPARISPPAPQYAYQAPLEEEQWLHTQNTRTPSPNGEVDAKAKSAALPIPKEEGAGTLSSEPAIPVPTDARAQAIPTYEPPTTIDTANAELPGFVQRPQTEPTVPAMPDVSRAKPTAWTVYRNTRLGFALRYPADIFRSGKGEGDNGDSLLTSGDGRALLRIFAIENKAATSLAQYRRSRIAERYGDAKFDYMPQRENWFVLSGKVAEEMFYERVTFSCDRRAIHGWLLVYPLAERRFFDAIVEEIHRSYRYDPGPKARCAEAE